MSLFAIRIGLLCQILLAFYGNGVSAADQNILAVELPSGQTLEIQRFVGVGESRLLWLPSERGFNEAHRQHASALADLGHSVWLVDLHDAYFVEPDRQSIPRFPLQDIVALIDAASAEAGTRLILLSGSRGAQLALIAAREWQLRHPGESRIEGLILTHPHLYESRPEVAEDARYLPVSRATNLPVYLLEAQYSTRSARIQELAEILGTGGSQVYVQVLAGVQGGFLSRDDSQLSLVSRAAKHNYAATLDRAIKALELVPTPSVAVSSNLDTRVLGRYNPQAARLTPITGSIPAPVLALTDINQQTYVLGEAEKKLVLINFWASWCRPCVEEIPSLQRLRDRIDDPDFEIVTVNVREDRARVGRFLERIPIDLPLLLDDEGIVSDAWKVYVYPSSYLVDHQGYIRYAYLGALEWDSPEIISIIQSLLKRP